MRAILIAACLAGCAALPVAAPVAAPGAAPAMGQGAAARAARIAAECRLLELAHAATAARMGQAPPDILVGCPGHEGLRDAMPLRAQSAALRVANAAALPPAVQAAGPGAARVYRRMISRGVPEVVAREVADGPLLRAAAAI